MGYVRLFRRVRIAPGLTMNLSKSGPSLSLGMRGAHVTMGRRGVTKTIGVPGTGVYWTDHSGRHTGIHNGPHFAVPESQPAKPQHVLGGCLLIVVLMLGGLFLLGL